MNRRELLFALAAAACGATPRRSPVRRRQLTPDAGTEVVREFEGTPSAFQNGPSPLAVHDDRLFELTAKDLQVWDTIAMKQLVTFPTAYRTMCVLQDGRLAALYLPPNRPPELHLIDASQQVSILTGPLLLVTDETRLLPAGRADSVYIVEPQGLVVRYRLREHVFEVAASVKLDDLAQLTSLGDGRIVGCGRHLLRVAEPQKPTIELPITDKAALMVPAGAGRAWYYGHEYGSPHTIVLARFTPDRLVAEARVDLGENQVEHLSGNDRAAAALIETNERQSVIVIDDHGTERWRVEVQRDLHSFVAITDHRVILRLGDDSLRAWDAATGKPVS